MGIFSVCDLPQWCDLWTVVTLARPLRDDRAGAGTHPAVMHRHRRRMSTGHGRSVLTRLRTFSCSYSDKSHVYAEASALMTVTQVAPKGLTCHAAQAQGQKRQRGTCCPRGR